MITRTLVRLVLALYPREVRSAGGADLDAAIRACVERERRRVGAAGVVYAWLRLAADGLAAAVLIRLDARRSRRIAARHQPQQSVESPMTSVWQDLVYAARGLRRAPGFALVVVVTLALAIGATTAIFSVVHGVLLRSLPYRDPDRLVMLYAALPKAIQGPIGFSAPDFTGLDGRVASYEAIAAFKNKEFELSGTDRPDRITGLRASVSLFEVLGVEPALGRSFTRDEDAGRQRVVVLSDGLWRRQFGADPSMLGRTITLDRQPYTVVGVMPRGFAFPNRGPSLNNVPADVYVPISYTNRELTGFASMYNNSVVGRLKPGVTVAAADGEARAAIARIVREVYPAPFSQGGFELSASVTPLRDEIIGRVQTTLYVLFAAVAVVLLIACADIANLMLTRAAARGREMAVRTALGAARSRLIRQILVESSLLAVTGGALGLLVAWWASRAFVTLAGSTIPRAGEIGLDPRVMLFALATSLLTAILCGLLPALDASRGDANDALKDGGRTGTAGIRQRRIFGALVTAQFALAAVLLIAGGLLLRSFSRLMAIDPGFRAERVLTMATSLPASAYPTGAHVRSFYPRLLERIERLPGVSAVGASTDLPLSLREHRAFTIELQPAASASLPHVVAHYWIAGRYFEAMGITLAQGRFLASEDHAASEPVVVINATMARQFWGDQSPVGQRIAWGSPTNHTPWMRIVGVVADVKQGPLSSSTLPQTFSPWLQVADAMLADNVVGMLRSMKILARTELDPQGLASAITAQVRDLDPALPVTQVRTMDDVVSESTGPQRFNTVVLGSFAALALLLAALGIGGVLATSISRRTQEIGVRMALGAQRADLLRMVLWQGMSLAIAGLAVGVPAAFALTRLMESLLFQTTPRDPLTFAGVGAVLMVVAAVACYVPARRATRVDPIEALRYE